MNIVVLLFELILLYILSRWLSVMLYELSSMLFHSRSLGLTMMTLLLFPGTVIHELSHLFTAEILGVRTGKLTLVPEDIQSEEIQTGSVAMAKTGPFRRAIIGLAPLIVGILALGTLTYLFHGNIFVKNSIIITVYYYLLFSISIGMFPSSVDLRGVWQLTVTLLIILIGASIAGFRIVVPQSAPVFITDLINSLIANLGVVLAINTVVLLTTKVLIDLIKKLLEYR